jgi:hypothetical protein
MGMEMEMALPIATGNWVEISGQNLAIDLVFGFKKRRQETGTNRAACASAAHEDPPVWFGLLAGPPSDTGAFR